MKLTLIWVLLSCCSTVLFATEKDELLRESRFPYFDRAIIDIPMLTVRQMIKDEESALFAWEKPYYDLLYTKKLHEGVTFSGFIWLYDTDVFYGRGDFPEARRTPLFEGNNFNRTLNNDLLRSDDYIRREGVVRGRMDVDVVRTFDHAVMSASVYIMSGENFTPENSSLYFNHVTYDYGDTWHFRIGTVYPYFDDFTLNKKETGLPGFEMAAKFSGGEFYFIAARPDFPLDFAQHTTRETVLYANAWDKDDVIHHFSTPYNVFEIRTPPVHVYRHEIIGGVITVNDITELCSVNHAEVIIPRSVLTPDTQKVVIVADDASQSSQQTMYLNAFQLHKQWDFENGSFLAACAYVDLHNDTHSTENIQGLIGPMDSNIWSLRAHAIYKKLRVDGQFAISKFTPDDNKYNVREIDALYTLDVAYDSTDAPLYFSGRYTRFGADFLPNILTLRDTWKIQQDKDADFRWDYEVTAAPGADTYNFDVKYTAGTEHSAGVRYSYDLTSNYKQHSKYAPYDPFYISYYGTESNGLWLYGEGIDDGRTILSMYVQERYKWLSLRVSYTRDQDESMIITPLVRDTRTYDVTLSVTTKPIEVSLRSTTRRDELRFDPMTKTFIPQEKDTTVTAEARYHYAFTMSDAWSFRLKGKLDYILDADTLYEHRSMPFRSFIANADVIDSDVLHHDGGIYAYYTLNSSSSICVFYVLDVYCAENSYNGKALDYFRYNRGIKFTTTFGIPDAYLNAFYDEDVTEFSEMADYTQSYKRIGAMLSMTF